MPINRSQTIRSARITPGDEGFTLTDAGGSQSVAWVHVAEIAAYRRDPAGQDILCLAFRLGQAGQYVEVDEEMPGYDSLLENLYDAFPEISRTWWQEVAAGLGPNRVTLYGLPAGESETPSPAERYLQQIHQRKSRTRSGWIHIGLACMGVWAAGGAQTFLTWWLGGWNRLLAVSLLPMVLVIVAAMLLRRPRTFFLLLAGFYLAEAIWGAAMGRFDASLAGKFTEGKFSYLLLPGVEILLGMAVMLLPTRRATVSKLR
ncbi:MAG: hypothetical protein JW849_11140 [Phycisphaerae bacterium]|nr:hypothetical protein [Phycisphaerae bacterium]